MGLFKRKNKYLKELKKQTNKSNNKYNFFSILIVIVLVTIMMIDSCSLSGVSFSDKLKTSLIEINEDDLNLVWSVKNVNENNLKTKLENSNLNELASDINPISIADAENNNPLKNMQLNFDEIGFFINEVFSFNSEFNLVEITWSINDENIVKIQMIYTYTFTASKNEPLKVYFKHFVDYNLKTATQNDTYFGLLNAPSLTFDDLDEYSQISDQILRFIFKSNLENEYNKSLCEMLGFASVDILNYGLYYNV